MWPACKARPLGPQARAALPGHLTPPTAPAPAADNGCLKAPPGLPDEKLVFLGDILSTAWSATAEAAAR